MDLKEELELLRGEPIEVKTGDPMEIPCIETSDADRLCKHPVVSVSMITYNHEPYIRQAIEGVMMQKTDFEFELVIGEDASTDRTREICLEYQKKYPDKIRVLWWHENLRKVNHPAGGNGIRNRVRCRGEFIALCEGDDYWIDPLKLQKQVDVMRKYPNVGFCITGAKILTQKTGEFADWNGDKLYMQPGVINSMDYLSLTMFGGNKEYSTWFGAEFWQMTATFLYRVDMLQMARKKYDIFKWTLFVGDSVLCLGLGSLADVYYIEDATVVYRSTETGITLREPDKCFRDTLLVRIYFYLTADVFLNYDIRKSNIWRLIVNYLSIQWIKSHVQVDLKQIDMLCKKCSRMQIGWIVQKYKCIIRIKHLLRRLAFWRHLKCLRH